MVLLLTCYCVLEYCFVASRWECMWSVVLWYDRVVVHGSGEGVIEGVVVVLWMCCAM